MLHAALSALPDFDCGFLTVAFPVQAASVSGSALAEESALLRQAGGEHSASLFCIMPLCSVLCLSVSRFLSQGLTLLYKGSLSARL